MQRIYTHSNAHFEVFTTVLKPQGRQRRRPEAEKMVVVHSYSPLWSDEVQLEVGDLVLVLPRPEETRWFGRLQDGRQGFMPSSCVMELSKVRALQRRHHCGVSRQSELSGGLDVGQGEALDPSVDPSMAPPGPQRSPSLMLRILGRVRRRNQSQRGETNGAFMGD
ncbi:hypothetical protein OYC64_011963 [Pagothenia borchgrevinki]|uniref:SH3 domain-containing protein n=1 Tax=Pagothenia borchgrevinki TaxID=8213 RepID=A0ABD2FHR9_PAGBO